MSKTQAAVPLFQSFFFSILSLDHMDSLTMQKNKKETQTNTVVSMKRGPMSHSHV